VTVYTLPVRASLHRDSTPWFPATTLAAALCFLGFTKRRRLQIFLLAVVCMAGMGLVSGCAGHHHPSNASSNKVTVTATSGTLQHTVDFQLNVQ